MKRHTAEQLNFTRQCGNRMQVWWKILFYRIPQFIYECISERIIKIQSTFAKVIIKIKAAPFLSTMA